MKRDRLTDVARIFFVGSVASVLSTAAVSLGSRRRTGRAAAGINAASQWVYGESARRQCAASWRYTPVAYLIHHASSVFWAGVFDSPPARSILPGSGRRAAATAAVAAVVDYGIVPRRMTPGFDSHLSLPAMAATYAAFGVGLWLGARAHRIVFNPGRRADRDLAARGH